MEKDTDNFDNYSRGIVEAKYALDNMILELQEQANKIGVNMGLDEKAEYEKGIMEIIPGYLDYVNNSTNVNKNYVEKEKKYARQMITIGTIKR